MPDLIPENTELASTSESTENTVTTPHAGSTQSSSLAGPLLLVWNTVMAVSTAILSFYVFIIKDNSAIPFVILGVVGLCLPPIVGIFRSMARSKQLRIELEQRMEEARLERIRQAKERELERIKREKILATNEEAIQEAIKNVDVAAYKINNSMESGAGGL